jgi:serpin B
MFLLVQCVLGGMAGVAAGIPQKDNPNLRAVVYGNSEFAVEMYKKAGASGEAGNIFFSPLSISTALSMTYAGARGETAKQMADTLRFKLAPSDQHAAFGALAKALKSDSKNYRLEISNALWGQQGYAFQPEFLELVKKYYDGGFNTVDFAGATEASRETINNWVEQKTANKIKDLLAKGSLTELTRLVLTNAIYFKGDWATKFKPDMTKPMPFQLSADKTIDAPMMRQNGNFLFAENDDVKVLELPYVGNELSMVLLLPKTNMADLDAKLDAARLAEWTGMVSEREVEIYLPKFKFETQYELKDLLSGMGMVDAFALPPADFSGISGQKDLYITKVIHKAIIEVNEEGSEAAAATAVIMGVKAVLHKPVFKADRPFLFMIRHNETGSILFMGRVNNPVQ